MRKLSQAFWLLALVPGMYVGAAYPAGRVFFDGFEGGNTSLWQQDSYRNRCPVVTASLDGVTGPRSGSYMARCNHNGTVAWNAPDAFETLKLDNLTYTNEIFYRSRIRLDTDFSRTSGSTAKLLRIFITSPTYNDLFASVIPGNSLKNEGVASGVGMATYWGGATGDNTGDTSGWHQIEYYINAATGKVKVWYDDVLVRDNTYTPGFGGTKWYPFYILSNFSDAHDALNHVYYDDMEVFTDSGSGATGSMSDGTVSGSPSPTPRAPTDVGVE